MAVDTVPTVSRASGRLCIYRESYNIVRIYRFNGNFKRSGHIFMKCIDHIHQSFVCILLTYSMKAIILRFGRKEILITITITTVSTCVLFRLVAILSTQAQYKFVFQTTCAKEGRQMLQRTYHPVQICTGAFSSCTIVLQIVPKYWLLTFSLS